MAGTSTGCRSRAGWKSGKAERCSAPRGSIAQRPMESWDAHWRSHFSREKMTAARSTEGLCSLYKLSANSIGVSEKFSSLCDGFAPLSRSIRTSSAALAKTAPCNGKNLSTPTRLISRSLRIRNFSIFSRSGAVDLPSRVYLCNKAYCVGNRIDNWFSLESFHAPQSPMKKAG